jgi:hypothetical protein
MCDWVNAGLSEEDFVKTVKSVRGVLSCRVTGLFTTAEVYLDYDCDAEMLMARIKRKLEQFARDVFCEYEE